MLMLQANKTYELRQAELVNSTEAIMIHIGHDGSLLLRHTPQCRNSRDSKQVFLNHEETSSMDPELMI
jgi:hypothetical protein